MLQNVLSFLKNKLAWFQIALGVWQIMKFTPLAGLIRGVMRWLLSFLLPGFFPAYKRLQNCPGYLFKKVKCVVLKGMSDSKTTPLTRNLISKEAGKKRNSTSKSQAESSNGKSKAQAESSNATSKLRGDEIEVPYLGDNFKVVMDGNKVLVNGKMSYYISDRQWEKICNMARDVWSVNVNVNENKVVFVKGCKFIWQKIATGEVMEFGEVLDAVIFENDDDVLISEDVWFLPVDLLEKSEGKLPKLLNLVGLIPRVSKAPFLVRISLTIAAAVLEFSESLRSLIDKIINEIFCSSVQNICNKLPYPGRRFVYLLFIWVENLRPRNDILLQVVRRDFLNVFIAEAAKTNIPPEATSEDLLELPKPKKKYEYEYEFPCGCSIVMKATYEEGTGKCKATMQHTNTVFRIPEERVFLNCLSTEEFRKIGTFLKCLATSKAGSLFKYYCNDNKVHVRGWRESLRHYEEAGFPEIYKLTLHRVIV